MKRKLLAMTLVMAVTAGMLTGCGGSTAKSPAAASGSSQASGSASAASTDSAVTKTAAGEYTEKNPYHLTFAYIEFYQQDETERKAVQDALNAYMIPTYHIEVEFLPLQYAEYQSTIQLMISGGDALDVMGIVILRSAV